MAPLYKQVMNDIAQTKETIGARFNHNIFTLTPRGAKYNEFKHKVLKQVNEINSKPLLKEAILYDGVM